MSKQELVEKMAEKAGLTKADAARALDAFTESVTEALKAGDKVSLVGFGTYATSERPAREGRNPRTGETVKIAARTAIIIINFITNDVFIYYLLSKFNIYIKNIHP